MNDELSRRLFAAARGETPPVPPADFARKVAAAVSYIRNSWGNRAGLVSSVEVVRYAAVPLE